MTSVTKPFPEEARHISPESLDKALIAIGRLLERAPGARSSKRGGPLTVAKVRKEAGVEIEAARFALAHWRAGDLDLEDRFDAKPPPAAPAAPAGDQGDPNKPCLSTMIREAKTDGDREAVLTECAARVPDPNDPLDEKAANSIRALLDEARKAAHAKREVEPPPEDPTTFLLASEEAMQAARALDWMVDDDRRARVLTYIAEELEADRTEHPNIDSGGV